jgi:hypothetical protein
MHDDDSNTGRAGIPERAAVDVSHEIRHSLDKLKATATSYHARRISLRQDA